MRIPTPCCNRSKRVFACTVLCGLLSGCNFISGRVTNGAGTSYYRGGSYTLAQQEFQRAVADNPQNPDYRHNLAMSLHKQGRLAEAEQVYRQTLSLNPAHQPSYHGLAMLYSEQGRSAEATSLLSSWVATQPYNPESHVEVAWMQRQAGDPAGAEQSLRQALRVAPNHPIALAQLGEVYENSGQPDQALAMYQRSLRSNWLQPQVHSRMAALRGRKPVYGAAGPLVIPPPTSIARFGPSQALASYPPPAVNADPAHTTHIGSEPPFSRPF